MELKQQGQLGSTCEPVRCRQLAHGCFTGMFPAALLLPAAELTTLVAEIGEDATPA